MRMRQHNIVVILPLLLSLPSPSFSFSASWIVWICCEQADSIRSSKRLNSSKHPHAPTYKDRKLEVAKSQVLNIHVRRKYNILQLPIDTN